MPTDQPAPARWLRRARPLLGTLVEIGVADDADPATALAAAEAGYAALQAAQAVLSRFEADSDVARCHAAEPGQTVALRPAMQTVLDAALQLRDGSGGAFDITQGSAPAGWQLSGPRGSQGFVKTAAGLRLDLGGIAKGHAVDLAVQALQAAGCSRGWVNAGGDLRCFGAFGLPLLLRCEQRGGVQAFGHLSDGAFATSAYVGAALPRRSALWLRPGQRGAAARHVSVCAPLCLWADALTKVVAASGQPDHPLLARHGAQAWVHA